MEENTRKNFAIIGCGGFVAPRHLKAIKETGNNLIVALDKNDSVGVLDKYFSNVHFFTEFERFDRHVEKLKNLGKNQKVDFVSICSPNYLHDSHIRFALRIGADAICEKPLVIKPWNLDSLEKLEKETGKKIYNILQLRLHPAIINLKKRVEEEKDKKYDIDLIYITSRGRWYHHSWKGDVEKSGGLVMNIGVHFFDILLWIFGNPAKIEVHYSDKNTASGYLELEKARVRWYLSILRKDLPEEAVRNNQTAYRSIVIDGDKLEFSDVSTDLHTEAYKQIIRGDGFGIQDSRPAIELVHKIVNSEVKFSNDERVHKMARKFFNRGMRK